jgi:hypothetical protein
MSVSLSSAEAMVSARSARVCVKRRTVLKLLEALEGDLELVLVGELCGVVHHLNPEKRYDRHSGDV